MSWEYWRGDMLTCKSGGSLGKMVGTGWLSINIFGSENSDTGTLPTEECFRITEWEDS